ncbi:hypothetical protein [Gimesia panareensis]|uniref:Uncharacterized protein n=1 Tax=Gimesia panareensis TaxID=2527978 RepID=A0A518A341_9PLAN|nr:hypothetical protein [Gimesia panareensis]QDU49051.1 hypothetical protein Pan110_13680 [Gimesia panareensis]QDV17781.1 hypothetical protein Pan153_24360 [Gimesia panareensis]
MAAVCLLTACQQADEEFLIGRWHSSGGPNMIFEKDGTVYSINRGPRRKGRYYLDQESSPATMIMDMRRSEINAVLYFDYKAFSPKHFQLTPTYVQRTGEKKKPSDLKRKLLFQKLDPQDPQMSQSQFKISTTPDQTR